MLCAQKVTTLVLHLDNGEDFCAVASLSTLIERINQVLAGRKVYVFIDEIQLKENAGLFMNRLFDKQLPVRFILSGSGSMELYASIQESMAGRKRVFEM